MPQKATKKATTSTRKKTTKKATKPQRKATKATKKKPQKATKKAVESSEQLANSSTQTFAETESKKDYSEQESRLEKFYEEQEKQDVPLIAEDEKQQQDEPQKPKPEPDIAKEYSDLLSSPIIISTLSNGYYKCLKYLVHFANCDLRPLSDDQQQQLNDLMNRHVGKLEKYMPEFARQNTALMEFVFVTGGIMMFNLAPMPQKPQKATEKPQSEPQKPQPEPQEKATKSHLPPMLANMEMEIE